MKNELSHGKRETGYFESLGTCGSRTAERTAPVVINQYLDKFGIEPQVRNQNGIKNFLSNEPPQGGPF